MFQLSSNRNDRKKDDICRQFTFDERFKHGQQQGYREPGMPV